MRGKWKRLPERLSFSFGALQRVLSATVDLLSAALDILIEARLPGLGRGAAPSRCEQRLRRRQSSSGTSSILRLRLQVLGNDGATYSGMSLIIEVVQDARKNRHPEGPNHECDNGRRQDTIFGSGQSHESFGRRWEE